MLPALFSFLESLARDTRFACRALGREAAFTTSAVLIAGLGIGASATVFNVFNTLLIRPLPFEAPDRLVWVANGTSENLSAQTVQVGNLQAVLNESRAFADMAGFSPFYGSGDVRLTGGSEPERLTAVPVTERFFPLLGIVPHLGRHFSRDECQWNAPKTVILDYGFWQRRLAADPAVVGRAIMLDGTAATVVGVLPATFDFAATFTPGKRADIFVPFPFSPETNRQGNTLAVIGRLSPGWNLPEAQAEATVIGERLKPGVVDNAWRRNAFRPVLSTLHERISGRFKPALLSVAGAIGLLMLLVCANLSNLLLTRASVRQRDLAVRAALGAEWLQLIRPLLVESLILAGAGGAVGLAIAATASRLVSRLSGTNIPLLHDVRTDAALAIFTIVVALLMGVAFCLLPALHVSRVAPQPVLARAGRGSIGSLGVWTQRAIVVTEIALVCVLLTGASLLIRSLVRVLDVDLGFEAEHVIAVRVDPMRSASTRESRNLYFDEVLRRVRTIPGVEAAGLTDALPLGDNFGWRRWTASTPGRVEAPDARVNPLVRMIDDGYFTAMKIPVRAGRGFTSTDTPSSESVIIVNEALAGLLWPAEDPLGRVVTTSGRDRRVIGVVGGVRYFAPERDSGAEMYMPLRQSGDYQVVDLVVRSSIPLANLSFVLRGTLRRIDRELPLTEFRTLPQLVDRSLLSRRLLARVIAGFAGFGLILASLGLYAVISYAVSQRRQEIGLRIALGASPRQVQQRVLQQTLALALAGVGIGLPVSWIAARAIQGLLFGVTSSDPSSFLATFVLLMAVVALAGYVPARRAAQVDPVTAIRGD